MQEEWVLGYLEHHLVLEFRGSHLEPKEGNQGVLTEHIDHPITEDRGLTSTFLSQRQVQASVYVKSNERLDCVPACEHAQQLQVKFGEVGQQLTQLVLIVDLVPVDQQHEVVELVIHREERDWTSHTELKLLSHRNDLFSDGEQELLLGGVDHEVVIQVLQQETLPYLREGMSSTENYHHVGFLRSLGAVGGTKTLQIWVLKLELFQLRHETAHWNRDNIVHSEPLLLHHFDQCCVFLSSYTKMDYIGGQKGRH